MSRHQRPSHEDEHVAAGGVVRAEDVGPSGSAELAMMARAALIWFSSSAVGSTTAQALNLALFLERRHAREAHHCRARRGMTTTA